MQDGSTRKVIVSILWQDGPNPVKIADPYASRQLKGWHLACFYGFEDLAINLLSRHTGQNSSFINSLDFRGRTALNFAAYAGHEELVGTLLGKGADPNKGDNYNVNPLHCAASKGFLRIVELLVAHGERRILEVNAQTKNPAQAGRFRKLYLLDQKKGV
jgi:ankyrin repeat protein